MESKHFRLAYRLCYFQKVFTQYIVTHKGMYYTLYGTFLVTIKSQTSSCLTDD